MNASPALNMRVLLDENSGSLSKQKIKDCLVFHPSGLKLLLGPQDFHSVDITAEQVELIGHEISQQADYTLFDVSDICSKAVDAVLKRSDMVLLVAVRMSKQPVLPQLFPRPLQQDVLLHSIQHVLACRAKALTKRKMCTGRPTREQTMKQPAI